MSADVLAVVKTTPSLIEDADGNIVAQTLEVIGHKDRVERAWSFARELVAAYNDREAVVELIDERDRLRAQLANNRCNSGHETLPLVLWDCPECHNETKRKLADLIRTAGPLLQATDPELLEWQDLNDALRRARGTP